MEMTPCLPLQQHPSFTAALKRMGQQVRTVDVADAAPVQTISRFGLRLASRGPVWACPPNGTHSNALRRSGLHLINSDGQDAAVLKGAGFRQIQTPSYVAELPLHSASKDRLATLKPKWRNTLRRAQAGPFAIQREAFCPNHHRWLLREDIKQQKAKGFRSLPHSLLVAFCAANPKSQFVFTALHAAEPIAAMLFLTHGRVATYHLGWSNEFGRTHAAHHALLDRASAFLAKRAILRLDLGAVDTVTAPGLARFKIGTGATIRPLGGTWLRVPGL